MKPILKPISDQVVVLFGATSGIGLETALQMVEKGARVAIIGRSKEGLNDALEQVRMHAAASQYTTGHANGGTHSLDVASEGNSRMEIMDGQILGIEAEASNWDEVRAAAEKINEHFGRIDTWVNIAGISEWALFEKTKPEEFRRIIDVNLIGQGYGAMAALPYLKRQGGALIFIASMAGRVAIPYQAAYNASKHGLLGLIDTLREEVKHTGVPVSVTAILPAGINTPLFSKACTRMGVEPMPLRPVYDAKLAARTILHAAEHPTRELIVGDAGYFINFAQRVAPTTTNSVLGVLGFREQQSDEVKSPNAPNNLQHHLRGYNQVEGEYPPAVRMGSPLTWLATHPKVRMGLIGMIVGSLGFLIGSRYLRQRDLEQRRLTYRVGHVGKDISHFGDKTAAFLTALPLISSLPWFRRKTIVQRVISALPEMPAMRRKKTLAQRIPILHRKKSLTERLPFREQRKAIAEVLPNVETVKEFASKLPIVERRQTLADRLPLGERFETVVEKLPFRK